MYSIYMLRTPLLLFHLILTVLRRIVMMSPWKTVGSHVPSSSSSAVCVLNMKESRRTVITKPVQVYTGIYMYILACMFLTISYQMICCTNLYSSTPLRNCFCPSRDLWRTRVWSSCTNHPQPRVCMWLQQRTWWAESPLCCCFWLETQHRQSLTCTASARFRFPDGLC
jgi:hypothetical protein